MLVSEQSRLRRLPPELNPKQRLFFDGIRLSIETADSAYSRLRETLTEISDRKAQNLSGDASDHRFRAAAVQDAWSIVDSLNRLRNLLNQTPYLKKNAPPHRAFQLRTATLRKLRNDVQHLDGTIQKLVKHNQPIWGTLNWIIRPEPDSSTLISYMLIPGTIHPGQHEATNPLSYESFDFPIDHISLHAYGHSVDLSALIKSTESLVGNLERALEDGLRKHFPDGNINQAGADLILAMIVEVNPPPS